MGDRARYRGTIALDASCDADNAPHLLALDAHDRVTVVRGTWRLPASDGPAGPPLAPSWQVATERDGVLGRAHGLSPSTSAGQPDRGTIAWSAALSPPLADPVEALVFTPVPAPPGWDVGGTVRVALPRWPPVLRTVPAEVLRDEPVRPPPPGPLGPFPVTGAATRPVRVVAVSTRLDTGRTNDPAVASLVAWPGGFDLHVTWDAHVSLAVLREVRLERAHSGWPAVDDRGGRYHGMVERTSASRPMLDLAFVPALDPGARALTVTLPDVTSLPVTGLGAVRATVPLVP